jgi:hypothetical protein
MNSNAPGASICAGAVSRLLSLLIGSAAIVAGVLATHPAGAASSVWVAGWVETTIQPVVGAEVQLRTLDGTPIGRSLELTNGMGLFYVSVVTKLPVEFVAEAHGGSLGGAVLTAVVENFNPGRENVYINPATTLVARELGDHPGGGLPGAEANVEHFLGLPAGYPSPSTSQLGDNPDFDSTEFQRAFVNDKASNGSMALFISRMEQRMDSSPGGVIAAPDEPGAPSSRASLTKGAFSNPAAGSNDPLDVALKDYPAISTDAHNAVRHGIAPSTGADGETTYTSSGTGGKVSPGEAALGETRGFTAYQFVSDLGTRLGDSVFSGTLGGGRKALPGYLLDAVVLGPDSGRDMGQMREAIGDFREKLRAIDGELVSMRAEQVAWARQSGEAAHPYADGLDDALIGTIAGANEKLKEISAWFDPADPDKVGRTIAEGHALMAKYGFKLGFAARQSERLSKVPEADQATLGNMEYYTEARLEFLELARECLAKMPLLNRLLVGGDANGSKGGYADFNRVVYHSQYFWTKSSTDRVRRHFLDYDFYQGAQYNAAMEYVTATYSTGTGKSRNLPASVVPKVARLIALHDSMREGQARIMAPYLKAPPPFEAIDPRTRTSWMSAGANLTMKRTVDLALDFNAVDLRNNTRIGASLGAASLDFGDWKWDGHYDTFHLPTKADVGVLQAAWQAGNASLPGASRLSFYGWLRRESAPGGRETWSAGDLEDAFSVVGAAEFYGKLAAAAAGRDENSVQFRSLQADLVRYYGKGIELHFANREKTLFSVNYWPSEGGTLWWTSTYEADNIAVQYASFNGMGPIDLYNAAKVYIFRFDTGSGNFLRDAIGQAWCAADANNPNGASAKFVSSPNIKNAIGNYVKNNGTFRDGTYYDRQDLKKFGATLIPVRQVSFNEVYWMPSSSAN